MDRLAERIEQAVGARPARIAPLAGGCVGDVRRVWFDDGRSLVAKWGAELAIEAWMLRTLRERSALPVPSVMHADDSLLLMDYIDSGDPITPTAEVHAAELLAALHDVTGDLFGLERDTVIGGLPQPNDPSGDWVGFFRDRRLLHMARAAVDEGVLPIDVMRRIDGVADRLDGLLAAPERPSLIHGDMWGGNVLVKDGRIAGFVDPAIYYADPEIELAFSTLFSTFGEPFFRRYAELRPLDRGFFETRKDLYNLYPLLVHVRLFGGGYVGSVDRIVRRFSGQ